MGTYPSRYEAWVTLRDETKVFLRPVKTTYQPIPRYPAVKRDIAVVVAEDISAQQLKYFIQKHGQPWLEAVELFDFYTGPPIAKGYKSLAFSLTYRSGERTLTEEDIASQWKNLVRELEQDLGAKLR